MLSFHVERSEDYGPLVARGTLLDDTPIAIATLRSTYRNELGSARGFRRINDPTFMANGYASFRQAMGAGVDYTFNWFYIDQQGHRLPALLQVPAARPGRRSLPADAGATASSTGRASSRSPRSRST